MTLSPTELAAGLVLSFCAGCVLGIEVSRLVQVHPKETMRLALSNDPLWGEVWDVRALRPALVRFCRTFEIEPPHAEVLEAAYGKRRRV